jgi:hypothetical protein
MRRAPARASPAARRRRGPPGRPVIPVAGGWNLSVQGHRIGSFPGRLWGGSFRRASIEQAFGEVASYGRSRTDMIDGRTDRAISGFRLNGAATPAGSFYGSAADGYYLGAHGATWFRLGGPGR